MAQPPKATILDTSLSWTIPEWNVPDITNWWTSWPSRFAPPSATPNPVHIELLGKSKLAWFQSFLELPHGITSHDTFGDVFARLDQVQLQDCFVSWTQAITDEATGSAWNIFGQATSGPLERNAANAGARAHRAVMVLMGGVPAGYGGVPGAVAIQAEALMSLAVLAYKLYKRCMASE